MGVFGEFAKLVPTYKTYFIEKYERGGHYIAYICPPYGQNYIPYDNWQYAEKQLTDVAKILGRTKRMGNM